MLNIAIVGGGPTALYALLALVHAKTRFAVSIFESEAQFGLGTPYDPAANPTSLLANIASFELPPVGPTLADWLRDLPLEMRRRYGVPDGPIDERGFYPRAALGGYFADAFRGLVQQAISAGHSVSLHRGVKVVDVAAGPEAAHVRYRARGGALTSASFEQVLIATGHRSAAAKRSALTLPAYPAPTPRTDQPLTAAILGASLTAIDVAVSLALQRGRFVPFANGLSYQPREGAAALRLEMRSRRAVLPEADYYFPYPYKPLRHCSAEALAGLEDADPASRLDLAFEVLRCDLIEEAPTFATKIGVKTLSANTFADAYFAMRGGVDPFAVARRNLDAAREGAAQRRPSPWRYVLLRAHEAFGALKPHLTEADAERFRTGLQRVFVDNYAAVPPLSVERLLALRAAGVLSLQKLAPGYKLRAAPAGVEIVEGETTQRYDMVIEARGEKPAAAREMPFPTLRLQILANQMLRGDDADVAVDDHLRLAPGVNPVGRIYLLAAPFLIGKRPFVQGLTSTQELAARAVEHMLARDGAGAEIEPEAVLATGSLYLGSGLVVSTPV